MNFADNGCRCAVLKDLDVTGKMFSVVWVAFQGVELFEVGFSFGFRSDASFVVGMDCLLYKSCFGVFDDIASFFAFLIVCDDGTGKGLS